MAYIKICPIHGRSISYYTITEPIKANKVAEILVLYNVKDGSEVLKETPVQLAFPRIGHYKLKSSFGYDVQVTKEMVYNITKNYNYSYPLRLINLVSSETKQGEGGHLITCTEILHCFLPAVVGLTVLTLQDIPRFSIVQEWLDG